MMKSTSLPSSRVESNNCYRRLYNLKIMFVIQRTAGLNSQFSGFELRIHKGFYLLVIRVDENKHLIYPLPDSHFESFYTYICISFPARNIILYLKFLVPVFIRSIDEFWSIICSYTYSYYVIFLGIGYTDMCGSR